MFYVCKIVCLCIFSFIFTCPKSTSSILNNLTRSTGDEAFKSGDHAGAIEAWSLCLNLTKNNRPFSSKLHLNRATAYLKLKNYDAAVKDCNMAIYYNEKYLKAYLRRAESYVLSNVPENIQLGIE